MIILRLDQILNFSKHWAMGRTWGKFSSLLAKKKHGNLKPQPEWKTFRRKRSVALVGSWHRRGTIVDEDKILK